MNNEIKQLIKSTLPIWHTTIEHLKECGYSEKLALYSTLAYINQATHLLYRTHLDPYWQSFSTSLYIIAINPTPDNRCQQEEIMNVLERSACDFSAFVKEQSFPMRRRCAPYDKHRLKNSANVACRLAFNAPHDADFKAQKRFNHFFGNGASSLFFNACKYKSLKKGSGRNALGTYMQHLSVSLFWGLEQSKWEHVLNYKHQILSCSDNFFGKCLMFFNDTSMPTISPDPNILLDFESTLKCIYKHVRYSQTDYSLVWHSFCNFSPAVKEFLMTARKKEVSRIRNFHDTSFLQCASEHLLTIAATLQVFRAASNNHCLSDLQYDNDILTLADKLVDLFFTEHKQVYPYQMTSTFPVELSQLAKHVLHVIIKGINRKQLKVANNVLDLTPSFCNRKDRVFRTSDNYQQGINELLASELMNKTSSPNKLKLNFDL